MTLFPEKDTICLKKLKVLAPIVGMVSCALILSGCYKRYETYPLEHVLLDETDRHPIKVSQNVKQMTLYVQDDDSGISERQKRKLALFFARYRQIGHGQIAVSVPSGGEQDQAMFNAAGTIKDVAERQGIAPAYFSITANRNEYSRSVILVSYNYSVAEAPKCGEWTQNLAENYTNLHYHNFGCSQQRNLAAMVANPRDLIEPRGGVGHRASERRDVIWDKYIKGEATVSERSTQEKGTVSEVAKE